MGNKVLFCATVDIHFKAFHLPYMKWFKEQGWEVHVAAAGNMDLPYVDKKYELSIQRSPLQPKNIKAYKELKAIIDKNGYKIIHCHTPMGGPLHVWQQEMLENMEQRFYILLTDSTFVKVPR